MAPADNRPVLIAGGGIGGLAAALGLAQKGIRSTLLEKSSKLGEIGAGIQLAPNAFHAFDYLGVGEAARGMAVYIDQLRLMDALTAEEIAHVDLREAFRALRQPLCGGASRRSPWRVPESLPGARVDRATRELGSSRLRSGWFVGDGSARERRACHRIAPDRR